MLLGGRFSFVNSMSLLKGVQLASLANVFSSLTTYGDLVDRNDLLLSPG